MKKFPNSGVNEHSIVIVYTPSRKRLGFFLCAGKALRPDRDQRRKDRRDPDAGDLRLLAVRCFDLDFERPCLLAPLSAVFRLADADTHFGRVLQESDQMDDFIGLIDGGANGVQSLGQVQA